MALQIGAMNTLEVQDITQIAYMLTDGEQEIFLHKRQATKPLKPGDRVEVFLYFDRHKRITATMNKPILDQNKPAFAPVVHVKHRLGVFLDIGLQKDLLLSKDDLPFEKKLWPKEGDEIFVNINVSSHQLTANIINRYEISKFLTPEKALKEGDEVSAYVIYHAEEGNVFLTKEGHYIFVYYKHMRNDYRLGEKEDVTIILEKTDGTYNGTCIAQKELIIDDDATRVLKYLKQHGGDIPFGDKSSPDVIQETFHMSKSAFKRALGSLYKEKLVTLEKTRTKLNKDID